MSDTKSVERRSIEVQATKKGKLYVVCDCGRRHYLDGYGAAHLDVCNITKECTGCGAEITIRSKHND